MGKKRTLKPALRIRNLNKSYGDVEALRDVTFEIPVGKVSGLFGPNGAGKTTLIKCITGLLGYEGSIKILNKRTDADGLEKIAYLGEDERYYYGFTGKQYLTYFGKLYRVENLEGKVRKKLKTVGLYNRRNDKIKAYSHGMKKRLGIARCLLKNPNLLILDEPMAGLDPVIKRKLSDMISKIAKVEKSILISTHQLKDIEDICNWIIILKDGKVRYYGGTGDKSVNISKKKEIDLHISDTSDLNKIESIKELDGVVDIRKDESSVKLIVDSKDKNVDKMVFRWLLKRDIDFSIKHDSIDSIYRGAFNDEE